VEQRLPAILQYFKGVAAEVVPATHISVGGRLWRAGKHKAALSLLCPGIAVGATIPDDTTAEAKECLGLVYDAVRGGQPGLTREAFTASNRQTFDEWRTDQAMGDLPAGVTANHLTEDEAVWGRFAPATGVNVAANVSPSLWWCSKELTCPVLVSAAVYNVDQVPLPFVVGFGFTYDSVGAERVWVRQYGSGSLEKRQATMQLCVSAAGCQVRAALIFKGDAKAQSYWCATTPSCVQL
jgi:hypothetical protein